MPELMHIVRWHELQLAVVRKALKAIGHGSFLKTLEEEFAAPGEGLPRRIVFSESQLIVIANGLIVIEPPQFVGQRVNRAFEEWQFVVHDVQKHLGRTFAY